MKELEDLVAANRVLAEYGVIDAYGHVSLRSPRDPNRYYLWTGWVGQNGTQTDTIEQPFSAVSTRAVVFPFDLFGSGGPAIPSPRIHGRRHAWK